MADIEKFKLYMQYVINNKSFGHEFYTAQFNHINGWCEPPTMRLINLAVRTCLKESEEYLEIGSYCGRSLVAALYNNKKKAHVVEPFGLFLPDGDNIESLWKNTVRKFNLGNRVCLHKVECQNFNDELPPIGVFYYDGNHDAGHTYHGLKKFEQYLSDQAIIIVDDYNIYGGPQTTRWPGYDPVNKPVKQDVDTWVEENQWANLFWVTPWLHSQAVIIYDRNKND